MAKERYRGISGGNRSFTLMHCWTILKGANRCATATAVDNVRREELLIESNKLQQLPLQKTTTFISGYMMSVDTSTINDSVRKEFYERQKATVL